jgi:hypothetical protein
MEANEVTGAGDHRRVAGLYLMYFKYPVIGQLQADPPGSRQMGAVRCASGWGRTSSFPHPLFRGRQVRLRTQPPASSMRSTSGGSAHTHFVNNAASTPVGTPSLGDFGVGSTGGLVDVRGRERPLVAFVALVRPPRLIDPIRREHADEHVRFWWAASGVEQTSQRRGAVPLPLAGVMPRAASYSLLVNVMSGAPRPSATWST